MWTIEIPNWCPPSVNKGRNRHFRTSHKLTNEVIEYLAAYNAKANVPKIRPDYRPVRRVSLIVRKKGALPDSHNLSKHFLDGLKGAGLIVDDSDRWCHYARPIVSNSSKVDPRCFTLVVIEDVPENIEELKAELLPVPEKKKRVAKAFRHDF